MAFALLGTTFGGPDVCNFITLWLAFCREGSPAYFTCSALIVGVLCCRTTYSSLLLIAAPSHKQHLLLGLVESWLSDGTFLVEMFNC